MALVTNSQQARQTTKATLAGRGVTFPDLSTFPVIPTPFPPFNHVLTTPKDLSRDFGLKGGLGLEGWSCGEAK